MPFIFIINTNSHKISKYQEKINENGLVGISLMCTEIGTNMFDVSLLYVDKFKILLAVQIFDV